MANQRQCVDFPQKATSNNMINGEITSFILPFDKAVCLAVNWQFLK